MSWFLLLFVGGGIVDYAFWNCFGVLLRRHCWVVFPLFGLRLRHSSGLVRVRPRSLRTCASSRSVEIWFLRVCLCLCVCSGDDVVD